MQQSPFALEKGWKFRIIDESRLYDQYWENINFLKRFKRSYIEKDEQRILTEILEKLGYSTVNQLPTYIFTDQRNILKAIHKIWILISKKIILCDLYSPLSAETIIWINDKNATKGEI